MSELGVRQRERWKEQNEVKAKMLGRVGERARRSGRVSEEWESVDEKQRHLVIKRGKQVKRMSFQVKKRESVESSESIERANCCEAIEAIQELRSWKEEEKRKVNNLKGRLIAVKKVVLDRATRGVEEEGRGMEGA